jgi:hypothetical protein
MINRMVTVMRNDDNEIGYRHDGTVMTMIMKFHIGNSYDGKIMTKV